MCQFFSLVSDGKGKPMYFDWKLRNKVLDGTLKGNYEPDSHTSIADYFGYKGEKEDKLNKYEYNPLTKVFQVDQLNTDDDSKQIEKFCKELDFKKIIPQLIIKPIIYPFNDFKVTSVTKEDLKLLKKWASVGYSVGNSVRDSVGDSVEASVGNSVWNSVGYSVRDSVRASVGYSVGNSVRDSVGNSAEASVGNSVWNSVEASMGNSVWNSVWASVWAYTSSYFKLDKWKYVEHKKGVNPFQSCIDLWEKGLVPSFDGTIWRLHSSEGIIWEGKI